MNQPFFIGMPPFNVVSSPPGPHDKAGKTQRAQRFAAWLLKTYGEEAGWPEF